MADPNENAQAVEDARKAVLDHPMCGVFEDNGGDYTVFYPAGDFRVDGVRVSQGMGKAAALRVMLERMEDEWVLSYPGADHVGH